MWQLAEETMLDLRKPPLLRAKRGNLFPRTAVASKARQFISHLADPIILSFASAATSNSNPYVH